MAGAHSSLIIAKLNTPHIAALYSLENDYLKFAKLVLLFVAVVAFLRVLDDPIEKPQVTERGILSHYECIKVKNSPMWLRLDIEVLNEVKSFTIPNNKKICDRIAQNIRVNDEVEFTYIESGYKRYSLTMLKGNGRLWFKSGI